MKKIIVAVLSICIFSMLLGTSLALATPDLIAVAPDNANVIASANPDTNEVKVSTDGGAIWLDLGVPEETDGNPAIAIYDIAISHQTDGTYYIAVAGTDSANVANIWYFDLANAPPTWTETNDLPGYSAPGVYSGAFAITFSPAFPIDYAMVAITAVWDGESNDDNIFFEAFSFNTERWNVDTGFWGYPVTITIDDGITGIESASILLYPAYQAFPAEKRLAFVNLSIEGDADAMLLSGLYRLYDYSGYPQNPVVNRVATSEVLLDLIKADVENSDLSFGIKNSLVAKLENAAKSLEEGNNRTAINKLNSFINEVEAQRGKAITTEQPDVLIAQAELVIDIILTNH
jgi:hypothetical protein